MRFSHLSLEFILLFTINTILATLKAKMHANQKLQVKSYDVVTFCVRRTGGVAKTDHGSAEKNRALRQWRAACKF
jgi:hypothetical protein